MSLNDCEKCWETPCTCGHNYRDWSVEKLKAQILMLKTVLRIKENSPKRHQGFGKAVDKIVASVPGEFDAQYIVHKLKENGYINPNRSTVSGRLTQLYAAGVLALTSKGRGRRANMYRNSTVLYPHQTLRKNNDGVYVDASIRTQKSKTIGPDSYIIKLGFNVVKEGKSFSIGAIGTRNGAIRLL